MVDFVEAVARVGSSKTIHRVDFLESLIPTGQQQIMPHPLVATRLVAKFNDDRKAVDHQSLQQIARAAIAHQGIKRQFGDLRVDVFRHLPGANVFVFVIGLQPFGGAILIVGVTEVLERIGERRRTAIVPTLIFRAQVSHAEDRWQVDAFLVGLRQGVSAAEAYRDEQKQKAQLHHIPCFR